MAGPAPWRFAGLIAVLLTGGLYSLTGRLHLNLLDEGFLWYGVIQTASGEIPGRDFQAYDPGRYYWGAAWSLIFGDGILALRLSTAIFQALGLFCGLLVARRFAGNPASLLAIGAALAVWMFPRHKLFDSSLSLMAVFLAVRLLEDPSGRRYLVSGIFVGLAAFFGRNHGLYWALGFLQLILLLHWKQREGRLLSKLGLWSGGVFLGFSPMLLLLAFVPGFAERFVESLLLLRERGTNIPLPVPWPWTLAWGSSPPSELLAELVVSGAFLLLAIAYPLGLAWSWLSRPELLGRRSVLVACVCIGLPYAHHAFARPGASHLAQSIQPLLLGLFALPYALGLHRRILPTLAVWGTLGLAGTVAAWGQHPQLATFGRRAGQPWTPHWVAGDRLLLRPGDAQDLAGLEAAVRKWVPPDDSVFMAPFRVTYYPLLRKVSPVWDLYMLWSASEEHQQRMIQALEDKGVDWALIVRGSLAGDPDKAFDRTHPKVVRYLARNFESVRDPQLPRDHHLLRRRADPSPGERPAPDLPRR